MSYPERNYGPAMLGGQTGPAIQGSDAPRQAELAEVHQSIERAVKSASEACAVLSALRDRFFGDRPQTAEKAGSSPMRGGILGALHDRSEALNGTLDYLHSLLNEITRVA